MPSASAMIFWVAVSSAGSPLSGVPSGVWGAVGAEALGEGLEVAPPPQPASRAHSMARVRMTARNRFM